MKVTKFIEGITAEFELTKKEAHELQKELTASNFHNNILDDKFIFYMRNLTYTAIWSGVIKEVHYQKVKKEVLELLEKCRKEEYQNWSGAAIKRVRHCIDYHKLANEEYVSYGYEKALAENEKTSYIILGEKTPHVINTSYTVFLGGLDL